MKNYVFSFLIFLHVFACDNEAKTSRFENSISKNGRDNDKEKIGKDVGEEKPSTNDDTGTSTGEDTGTSTGDGQGTNNAKGENSGTGKDSKDPSEGGLGKETKDYPRANIIFFLTDDQRAEALGIESNGKIITPTMDEIAKKGVVFKQAYASTSICEASRASIMTGKYEYHHGVNFDAGNLKEEDWNKTYPAILHNNGYFTGFAGKFGFDAAGNYRKDFDKWGGFAGSSQGSYETSENESLKKYSKEYPHVSRALGAFGRDFLKEAKTSGKPFCLSISFKAPHLPYDYVDPIDRKLYSTEVPYPVHDGDHDSSLIPLQAKLSREFLEGKSWLDNFQQKARPYYQLIAGADAGMKMVLDELEAQGLAENTVIIFTSDNGYNMGTHGFGDKVTLYNSSTKIPLVVYDPRRNKPFAVQRIVANIDIAPTILKLAKVTVPEEMDGSSLDSLLDNTDANFRESTLLIKNWAWTGADMSRSLAVVTEKWKYIYWPWFNEKVEPVEELYDMKNDPVELKSVAGDSDKKDALQEMQMLYDKHLTEWSKHQVAAEIYMRGPELYRRGKDKKINFRPMDYIGESDEKKQMVDLYNRLTKGK